MKAIRSIIGFMLAPLFVMSVWGEFAAEWGVIGGWLAGLAIIGPLWFINHYLGLIPQDADASFVDLGLAVGIGGIAKGVFSGGGMDGLIATLPTIAVVVAGAVFGGILAGYITKEMNGEKQ